MSFDSKFDRKSSIGASEAAAVLGVDPYRTPYDVWLEKRGVPVADRKSPYSEAGNTLEAAAADRLAKVTGWDLKDPARTYRHPAFPFLSCTPDRIIDSTHGVELKTIFSDKSAAKWGDRPPLHYEIQCRMCMAIMDAERWTIYGVRATLDPLGLEEGATDHCLTIDRDLKIERLMLADLIGWWVKHVEGGETCPKERRERNFAGRLIERWEASSVSEAKEAFQTSLMAFYANGGAF